MRAPLARPSVARSQQAAAASARARDPAAPGSTWRRTRQARERRRGNAGTSLRSSTIGCNFSRGTSDSGATSTTTPVSARFAQVERAPSEPLIDGEPVGNPIIECRFRGDGKGDARDRPWRQFRRKPASIFSARARSQIGCSRRNAHHAPEQLAASPWFITPAKIGSQRLWIILCVTPPKHFPGQRVPRRGSCMRRAKRQFFHYFFSRLGCHARASGTVGRQAVKWVVTCA